MESQTTASEQAQSSPPPESKTPDLVSLAAQLATKHQAGGAAAAPIGGNRGHVPGPGRPKREVEIRQYLEKQGLKTVPVFSTDGPSVDPCPAQPGYTVDPGFVKSCAETLLKGIEAWRVGAVYRKALAIGDDKTLAKQLSDDASAPPGAIEVMSMCAGELAAKYDFLAAASPEALFITAGVVWAAKDLALWKRLRELEGLKAEKTAPPPN